MKHWLVILLLSAVWFGCQRSESDTGAGSPSGTGLDAKPTVEDLITQVAPKELLITPSRAQLKAGERIALTCIGIFPYDLRATLQRDVVWSVEPAASATIDERGLLIALQPGEITVQAEYRGVRQEVRYTIEAATLHQILVFPEKVQVTLRPKNQGYEPQTVMLETYGLTTDGRLLPYRDECSWSSPSEAVTLGTTPGSFVVGKEGIFEVITDCQGLEARKTIEVRYAAKVPTHIRFVGAPYTMARGERRPLGVTVFFDDGSSEVLQSGLAFTGIDPIARVEGQELVAQQTGEAVLRARYGNLEVTSAVQVTPARILALRFRPEGYVLAVGRSTPFQVMADLSDGTSEDVTSTATVTAVQSGVLSVSQAPPTISGTTSGVTQLQAQLRGYTALAAVNVGQAILERLEIDPPTLDVIAGRTQNFVVRAVYSDGSRVPITSVATVTPLQLARAEVPTGQPGVLRGKSQGQTTLSASYVDPSGTNGTGTAQVTVRPPVLEQLLFDPASATEAMGRTRDFRIRGRYSDSTEVDVTSTAQVMVDVVSPGYSRVGTVSLLTTGRIRVQGTAMGTMALVATVDGITASALYNVTDKEFDELQIVRTSAHTNPAYLLRGETATFRAIAIYSDQSEEDVSQSRTGVNSVNTVWNPPPSAIASLGDQQDGQKTMTALSEGDAQFSVQVTTSRGTRTASFGIGVYTPCPSPGQVYSYFCVYLGAPGNSCDTTCANQSRVYHPSTASFFGSGASSSNSCNAVLFERFRSSINNFNFGASATVGVGCSIFSLGNINIGLRESLQATTAGASFENFARVCACQD